MSFSQTSDRRREPPVSTLTLEGIATLSAVRAASHIWKKFQSFANIKDEKIMNKLAPVSPPATLHRRTVAKEDRLLDCPRMSYVRSDRMFERADKHTSRAMLKHAVGVTSSRMRADLGRCG